MIFFLAALVGLSLGLLGAGGSVLALPILRYGADLPAAQAVAMSLATVGAVSLVGAVGAWSEGRLRLTKGLLFAFFGSLGTLAGVFIASRISGQIQMAAFVLVMVVTAYRMLKPKDAPTIRPTALAPWVMVPQALGVGVVTGVVGVGGGFLIVPALVLLFRMPMKEATGTSLLVIAINSMVGLGAYSMVLSLDWSLAAKFTGAALVGLVAGQLLGRQFDAARLQKLFGGLLVLMILFVGVQELL